MNLDVIFFWVLLADSIIATLIMFFGPRWYMQHFALISRFFPAAKGWPILYLALVLWVGSLLHRAGELPW